MMQGGGGPMGGAMPAAPESETMSTVPAAERTITMDMDNIPLGEAIRYICMGSALKFKIESNAVIIADRSVPIDEMETRFFSVEAGVLDSARTRRRASRLSMDSSDDDDNGGGGGDDDDDDDDNGGQGGDDQQEPIFRFNLVEFFRTLGVDFPAGSSIGYNQRTSKLVVKNTPEGLRKTQKILDEINVTPTQVTIEAKFVEIFQTDLQELGFSWLITNGDGSYNTGAVTGNPSYDSTTGESHGYGAQILKQGDGLTGIFAPQLTNGLRGASKMFVEVAEGSDELLSVNSVLGSMAFNTIIRALAQQSNSDVLSAPKVTTLSGNTAIIRMVEERYFPDSWSEPDITPASQNQGGSFTPSIPEFSDARDVGVILEVTPTVAADGYSIDLELRPQVIEFVRYDDSFNYTMVVDGIAVEAKALMPILAARTVETKVIVWDGETVVLGGMIKEKLDKYNDKVPILGDIPLIGRLFQSKGERSAKTNLLVFVTARLVNPAGLPIRANEVRGLPDFRR